MSLTHASASLNKFLGILPHLLKGILPVRQEFRPEITLRPDPFLVLVHKLVNIVIGFLIARAAGTDSHLLQAQGDRPVILDQVGIRLLARSLGIGKEVVQNARSIFLPPAAYPGEARPASDGPAGQA